MDDEKFFALQERAFAALTQAVADVVGGDAEFVLNATSILAQRLAERGVGLVIFDDENIISNSDLLN